MRLRICLGIVVVMGLALALKLRLLFGLVSDETLRTIAAIDAAALVLLFVYSLAALTSHDATLKAIVDGLTSFLGGRHGQRVPTRGMGRLAELGRRINELLGEHELDDSAGNFKRVVRPTDATDPELRAQILGGVAAKGSLATDAGEGVGPVRVRPRKQVDKTLAFDTEVSGPPEGEALSDAGMASDSELPQQQEPAAVEDAVVEDNTAQEESAAVQEPADSLVIDVDAQAQPEEKPEDGLNQDEMLQREQPPEANTATPDEPEIPETTRSDVRSEDSAGSADEVGLRGDPDAAGSQNKSGVQLPPTSDDSGVDFAPALSIPPTCSVDEIELERRELYAAFLKEKQTLGEPIDDLDFASFEKLLDDVAASIKAERGCERVRFDVRVAAGKVALQPRLVRQKAQVS